MSDKEINFNTIVSNGKRVGKLTLLPSIENKKVYNSFIKHQQLIDNAGKPMIYFMPVYKSEADCINEITKLFYDEEE